MGFTVPHFEYFRTSGFTIARSDTDILINTGFHIPFPHDNVSVIRMLPVASCRPPLTFSGVYQLFTLQLLRLRCPRGIPAAATPDIMQTHVHFLRNCQGSADFLYQSRKKGSGKKTVIALAGIIITLLIRLLISAVRLPLQQLHVNKYRYGRPYSRESRHTDLSRSSQKYSSKSKH